MKQNTRIYFTYIGILVGFIMVIYPLSEVNKWSFYISSAGYLIAFISTLFISTLLYTSCTYKKRIK